MQQVFQLKHQKTAEIMYLEGKKQQTKHCLTYSDVSKKEKKYD